MVSKTLMNLQVIGTTEEVSQRMFTPGHVVADVRPVSPYNISAST